MKTIKFKENQTYIMSWVGDSELKTPYKIIKRTAKMITVQCRNETKTKLCKISIYEGVEQISPTGKYSMSPILRADKLQKIETPKPAPAKVEMKVVKKDHSILSCYGIKY